MGRTGACAISCRGSDELSQPDPTRQRPSSRSFRHHPALVRRRSEGAAIVQPYRPVRPGRASAGDRRGAVAHQCADPLGNFELDFADGELRFRASLDVEEGLLSEKMVGNMLGFSMHSMERFHDALMRIAFGDGDPELSLVELP